MTTLVITLTDEQLEVLDQKCAAWGRSREAECEYLLSCHLRWLAPGRGCGEIRWPAEPPPAAAVLGST